MNVKLKFYGSILLLGFFYISEVVSIHGGEPIEVNPHRFSYTVSVRSRNKHICGGALISRQHVLTAAHCISKYKEPRNYKVLVGTINFLGTGGTFIDVKSVDYSDKYDLEAKPEMDDLLIPYDIVVLTLKAAIPVNSLIKPIPLNTRETSKLVHESCTFTGWGQFDMKARKSYSPYLKLLRTKFTDQGYCQQSVAGFWVMDESHFCISQFRIIPGVGHVGANYGDDGGPLVCSGHLAGILSTWTAPESALPEIYIKVAENLNFINRILRKKI